MFAPRGQDLERGWPGRIEGETVIQLAAQTLQAFFSGGGQAREHAEYPLADVVFRAPVLHPPSVRIFDDSGDFVFANPAAIRAVGEEPEVAGAEPVERVAAILGADGAIGGFTPLVEWVAPQLQGAKQRDFALVLGPVVTTPDEGFPAGVDWEGLVSHAAENTTLYPGDLIVR
jgi:PAS domain-containing protein